MADYWLQFSEVLTHLTADEEAWLRSQLQEVAVHGDTETEIDDGDDDIAAEADWVGPRFLRNNPDYDSSSDVPEFQFKFDDDRPEEWGRHLWLHAEDVGNPSYIPWLVQKFLKQFRPDECWSLTWATTCSRPQVGEFGGGAVFVTAEEIKWNNVYQFIVDEMAAFKAKRKESVKPAEPLGVEATPAMPVADRGESHSALRPDVL